MTKQKKIFVSYRRDDDGAYLVPELNRKLTNRYGTDSVFYDIDNIPLGVDFREHLSTAISSATIVLVVIGDRWAGYDAQTGLRRINLEDDFVRIEVEAALNRGIPVVPVLVGKATMPCEKELPESIAKLAYRNAAEVRTGKDYELHMAELLRGLDAIMGAADKSVVSPPVEDGHGEPLRSISAVESTPVEPSKSIDSPQTDPRSKTRFLHPDGSVVFLEHRQVWVGYAEGRIVCTKKSAEKVVDFLHEKFGLEGAIVENGSDTDEQSK